MSSPRAKGLSSVLTVLAVVGGLLVLLGLWIIGGYNGLVSEDTLVEQKSADVQSQLKRRADLVPNLVQTVKGYAKHESQIFTDVANARSRLLSADVTQNPQEASKANAAFSSSLGRLLAIAENYPALKADANFIRLQDELAGTENRINYARLQYNERVASYNLKVRTFPTSIVAGIAGFNRRLPFEASTSEQATPQVSF